MVVFMKSITSEDYISTVEWLKTVVQDCELILCEVSALEYLELFNGYMNESKIQVYAKDKGQFSNMEYNVVDSFDGIDYFVSDGVMCTTLNQTINDMLANYDNIDELAFLEALSNYYFSNNNSFDNLVIKSKNIGLFNQLKEKAITYYTQD